MSLRYELRTDASTHARARLSKLCEIGRVLTTMRRVDDESMGELLAQVCATLPLRSALLLLDDPRGADRPARAWLWHGRGTTPGRRTALGGRARATYGHLVTSPRAALLEAHDLDAMVGEADDPGSIAARVDAGLVLLPLSTDHHAIFGALQLEGAARLDEADLSFVDAVASHVAIAIARLVAVDDDRREAEAARSTAEQAFVAAARGERSQRLLSETSAQLAEALDERSARAAMLAAAVPQLADICIFDAIDDEGRAQRIEVAFDDPAQGPWAEHVRGLAPHQLAAEAAPAPVLVGDVTRPPWLDRLPLDRLGVDAMMVVPLVARGRTLGILTLLSTTARRYDEHDLALAADVAHRGALATISARLHEQAELAIRAREDVLALVSHDLRSPLGVILMSASRLRHTLAEDDTVGAKCIAAIQRAGGRMDRMICDLLDLAGIANGTLALAIERHSAMALVAEAIDEHEADAARRGIRLAQLPMDDRLDVDCDRGRLLQVLGNLVGNAIKFSGTGRNVVVHATVSGSSVMFTVSDEGPGIPADELPHLFERYWRGADRVQRGTGLGLAIAKAIVEGHGGTISATSELGRGSTFSFSIPCSGVAPG